MELLDQMTPRDEHLSQRDTPSESGPHTGLAPVDVFRPAAQSAPVVFASPHSGRNYPSEFIQASQLDSLSLRRSEDAFVDELFGAAPRLGAPFLCANFPRAYVDVNREAYELDPRMFKDPLPDYVVTRSPRIAAGLGTVAKVVANGEEIYAGALCFTEVRDRIERTHTPYHRALRGLLDDTRTRFKGCLLVDCHSMPSSGAPVNGRPANRLPDIILGDCHGTACTGAVVARAEAAFKAQGFSTTRNRPYAGGYTTRHYGRPKEGIHVLQIEVNRALYLDEERIRRGPDMARVTERLTQVMAHLTKIAPALLKP